MKKTILLAAFAVFGFTQANAQEEETAFDFSQGNIFIEGNLGFNSNKDNNTDVTTSSFNFNPKAGYFINDDFALGLQLGIGSSKVDNDGSETTNSSFNAGVFGRYYFLDLGKRFKTFAEFGGGINSTKSEQEGVDEDFKTNGFNVGAGLGINYFVKENIAITFGLTNVISYTSNKVDADGQESVTNFGFNANRFNNFFETAQFGLLFKL